MTPVISTRERVERLQEAMNAAPQVDCPVRHYFAPGLFAREITIPAGTCLVGAVHRTENLAVLSSGRLRLVTDDGVIEVSAPAVLTIRAGVKNAALAIETAVWTNFFPNTDNENDIEKLVTRLTESTSGDLLGGKTNQQLAANKAAELEH
jgi:hypothetical protein